MASETYFVTGATGLLGEALVPVLRARAPDAVLRLLVRGKRPWSDPHIDYVDGELCDEEALRRGAAGADAIVHLAALSHARTREAYWQVNVGGTGRLLAAARAAGTPRFVFVSSRYADPSCGAYGASKREAEQQVCGSGVPYVIVRFGELYGWQSVRGLEQLVRGVRRLPCVPYPNLPATFAPLSTAEAADVLARLVTDRSVNNRRYALTGPVTYTIRELLEVIACALGVRRLLVPVPAAVITLIHRAGRAMGLPLDEDMISRLVGRKDDDISAARRELGFEPVPFDQGARTYFRGPPPSGGNGVRGAV